MKVFATQSCQHLIQHMDIATGALEQKTFSDGELYLKIQDDVAHKCVGVLAATPPPSDTLLELLMLLDALQREKARITLAMPYFGYARQDRAAQGEPLTAEIIFRMLLSYKLEYAGIVHIHNPRLQRFFYFEDIILLDFFLPCIDLADIIIAPDEGAGMLVQALSQITKKPCSVMKKERKRADEVHRIVFENNVKGKNVIIIDDMISTGRTVVNAAQVLKEHDAADIYVAATHGIFSNDAFSLLAASPIKQIFVTNTLASQFAAPNIEVVDCASMIEQLFHDE